MYSVYIVAYDMSIFHNFFPQKLTTAPSVSLVFQSLCQFFSSVDPRGLLELPKVPTEVREDRRKIEIITMVVMVAMV